MCKKGFLLLSIFFSFSVFSQSLVCHFSWDKNGETQAITLANDEEGNFFAELDSNLSDEEDGVNTEKKSDLLVETNKDGVSKVKVKIKKWYKIDFVEEKITSSGKSSDLECHNSQNPVVDMALIVGSSPKGFAYKSGADKSVIRMAKVQEDNYFSGEDEAQRLPASEEN